jgi:hypothetical protein
LFSQCIEISFPLRAPNQKTLLSKQSWNYRPTNAKDYIVKVPLEVHITATVNTSPSIGRQPICKPFPTHPKIIARFQGITTGAVGKQVRPKEDIQRSIGGQPRIVQALEPIELVTLSKHRRKDAPE